MEALMAAPRKYGVELQERATRMAMDARKDPESARGAIKRVADQLGVHPDALRNWVRQAEIDGSVRPGTTTDDATRIAELEREVREVRRANRRDPEDVRGVFRRSGARPQDQDRLRLLPARCRSRWSSSTSMGHRDCVVEGRTLGAEPICAVLRDAGVQIAPSTYYAAKSHVRSARAVQDAELTEEIKHVHAENLAVYGVRPVTACPGDPGGGDGAGCRY
jgi:transposase-like protein